MASQAQNHSDGHRTAAFRVLGPSRLKIAPHATAAADIASSRHVQPSTFTALVQDFIDDCGYSDK